MKERLIALPERVQVLSSDHLPPSQSATPTSGMRCWRVSTRTPTAWTRNLRENVGRSIQRRSMLTALTSTPPAARRDNCSPDSRSDEMETPAQVGATILYIVHPHMIYSYEVKAARPGILPQENSNGVAIPQQAASSSLNTRTSGRVLDAGLALAALEQIFQCSVDNGSGNPRADVPSPRREPGCADERQPGSEEPQHQDPQHRSLPRVSSGIVQDGHEAVLPLQWNTHNKLRTSAVDQGVAQKPRSWPAPCF